MATFIQPGNSVPPGISLSGIFIKSLCNVTLSFNGELMVLSFVLQKTTENCQGYSLYRTLQVHITSEHPGTPAKSSKVSQDSTQP